MFKVAVSGADEVIKLFDPSVVRSATTRTLNELGSKAKTISVKSVTERFLIKKKDLSETSTGDSRIKMRAAYRGNDTVVIDIEGRPISLAYFGAKQVTRTVHGVRITDRKGSRAQKRSKLDQGVTVEIVRGKKTTLGHSFIAKVKAGKTGGLHTGVFIRSGKARLPIYEKRMITVASMFQRSSAFEAIESMVSTDFTQILARNLDWYQSR